MLSMDHMDTRLIELLRSNARVSVAELSKQLGAPRGTVHYRLRRLELEGVIEGYTVRLRRDASRTAMHAWMSLAVRGSETRAVVKRLLGEPCVAALHDTNGRWDLLVELEATDSQHLSTVLEKILRIPGVEKSETSIHLATFR
jgi:DNA-binding Lrp family transcriptional regulator